MNSVVHFEVPFDDAERAQKFYENVFGWNISKVPMPGGDPYYIATTAPTNEKTHMIEKPGAINGGLTKRAPKEQGENTVIVINVPSVSDAIAGAEKNGGKLVMSKVEIMGMGLYARVKDSEGNVVGLWEDIKK